MKAFFQQRSPREQTLLVIFAVIGLAWWGSSVAGRTRRLGQEWRDFRTDVSTQELWLKNRTDIMARVTKAGQALDPAKALDSAQSFAELNTMLAGLNAELGSQRTDQSGPFVLHSVQVNIRQAGLAALLQFYARLSARAPYLGIDQCVLATDRTNSGLLNATFRIYSIEMTTP
ncbi:MAG: hypothetical protein ACHQ4G_06785 [Opitutales bacterium]